MWWRDLSAHPYLTKTAHVQICYPRCAGTCCMGKDCSAICVTGFRNIHAPSVLTFQICVESRVQIQYCVFYSCLTSMTNYQFYQFGFQAYLEFIKLYAQIRVLSLQVLELELSQEVWEEELL